MTDKVQKIREEVERLKSNLVYGACSSQVAMETRCKEEAYDEVLSFIDSLQEEPTIPGVVDEHYWEMLGEEPVSEEKLSNVQRTVKNLNEDFENALAEEWKGYNDRGAAKVDALEDNTQELAFAKGFYRGWHYMDDDGLRKAVEGVIEDLGDYINELSKQFSEVSFAKLSRIAVRVAKWQKEKDAILPKVWNRENLDDFSYQTAYDLSNDWAKETPTWHDVEMACKLGAKWQKDSLWKPADGDDLPEYDREVIVLINYNAQCNIHNEEYPTYRVGFGHRPNPNGWDGKNIDTNVITHYTPKLYDKGGWNAPNIVYWLDLELPKTK